MKKIALTIILMFIVTINTFAQQAFKTYLPKEGLASAVNQAKTEGLIDPILMLLATTSQKFEQMPSLLQPTVEINTGKASIWMYQFKDKNIDTLMKMILVLKISTLGFDQFVPISIPIEMNGELPVFVSSLEGKQWLQTDSVFASIRRNNFYQGFAKVNINHFVLFSFLGVNEATPGMEPDTPYWMTMIVKDTTESSMDSPMTCITNAITNETVCIDITSVNHNNYPFRIFPNPTNDLFYISFEKQSVYPTSISIINLQGIEVMSLKVNEINGQFPINIGHLPAGEYLIWIHNPEINSLNKIIKQ